MLLRQFDEFFPLFFFPGFLAEFSEQMPFQDDLYPSSLSILHTPT